MAVDIFLGEPPAHIKQWIIEHATPPGPVPHADTRFTLEDGTVETYNITGTINRSWMVTNGYWSEDKGQWLKTITQADIGNTVTSIGEQAFDLCEGLTSVTIPNSVTSIGNYAFSSCPGLTRVTIPDSVTSIGEQAFYYCEGLAGITIGSSVTSIGAEAFSGCLELTNVIIPNDVTSIGNYAFSGCSGLTSVTIGNSVTSIGDGAFGGCRGLTSVTIPNDVTSIGVWAFYNCSDLVSVTFDGFNKNQVKSMTTEDFIFGEVFFDPDTDEPMAKSFTAVCTDGSMTVHFSAEEPATITFTNL